MSGQLEFDHNTPGALIDQLKALWNQYHQSVRAIGYFSKPIIGGWVHVTAFIDAGGNAADLNTVKDQLITLAPNVLNVVWTPGDIKRGRQ